MGEFLGRAFRTRLLSLTPWTNSGTSPPVRSRNTCRPCLERGVRGVMTVETHVDTTVGKAPHRPMRDGSRGEMQTKQEWNRKQRSVEACVDDRRRPRRVPPKAHAPCPMQGHTATIAEGLGSGLACKAGPFVWEIASSKIAARGDEPEMDPSARIALCAARCVHVPVCTRNRRGFLPVPTSVVALYGTRNYLYAQPDADHARTCLLAFMVACIARRFLYAASSSFARHHFLGRIVRLLDRWMHCQRSILLRVVIADPS